MWLLTSVRPKPGPLSVSVLEPILFSETKTSNVLMFATSFRDISFWFLGALLRWKKYPSFQYWQLNSLFEMWLRYWLKVSVSVSVLDQNQSSGFGRSLDHTNNQIKAELWCVNNFPTTHTQKFYNMNPYITEMPFRFSNPGGQN